MEEFHFELMQIGCLAFMAFYQLVMFFQVRKKYYLYLSIICATILVRSTLVGDGSQFMFLIFPDLTYEAGRKIEFICAYSNIFTLPLFINDIFKFRVFSKYIRVLIYVASTWLVIILFTPYEVFVKLDSTFQIVLILAFLLVFRMLYLAIKDKKTGANYMAIGISCCFIFVVLEILRINDAAFITLEGPNLINTGIVIFLFFLTASLSSIFAESFNENVILNTQLNQVVLDRTQELSESNLVKDHIIRTISHDLRSPLANLQGLVGLVKMSDGDIEKVNEHYGNIEKGIGYSLNMLDDLLAWASSNRKGEDIKIHAEDIKLQQLLNDKILNLQHQAIEKNIALLNKVQPGLILHSDRNVIKVILRNLIVNAIKFTHPNGQITISSNEQQGSTELIVQDNGIGVPDDMKATIFEMNPKNKRPGTSNEKSTGIGLAIVKDLADQINAKITVTDNPESKGAAFSITFPT